MLTRLAHGSDSPERWRELLLCREDDDESKANVARLCSSRLRAHSDLTLSSDPATRRRLLLIRGAPALRHHSHIELAFLSSAARRWIASEYHIDRGLRPGFFSARVHWDIFGSWGLGFPARGNYQRRLKTLRIAKKASSTVLTCVLTSLTPSSLSPRSLGQVPQSLGGWHHLGGSRS